MIAGARVEVAPYKKHPADFVLWKPSTRGPAGLGHRPGAAAGPGWHIECSAMSGALLGEVFDIHGGGIDLIFPHHENEIAQSRCAHGTPVMARYWMHNGFVQVNGQKMSKSLGNYFTVHELLEEGHRGEAIRLALLSSHYRQPTDITRDGIKEAKAQLDRFYGALQKHADVAAKPGAVEPSAGGVGGRSQHAARPGRHARDALAPQQGERWRSARPRRRCSARGSCWACCSRTRPRGCKRPMASMPPRSSARSRPASRPARPRTSPKPTASARTCGQGHHPGRRPAGDKLEASLRHPLQRAAFPTRRPGATIARLGDFAPWPPLRMRFRQVRQERPHHQCRRAGLAHHRMELRAVGEAARQDRAHLAALDPLQRVVRRQDRR